MLECLVNLNLNTSLSLLLLCTVAGDDLLSLSEVGSDGLRTLELSGALKVRVLGRTNLCGEVSSGAASTALIVSLLLG